MRICDLLTSVGALDDQILEGDNFELEIDDFLLETVVVGMREDGPVIAVDDVALPYIPLDEAEYQGRKVSLGKPFLTPDGPKKRSVYVKNSKGNIVKVNFGDKKLRIKKSNPNRRKSFRARHHCENPGPRHKARYWSCRAW